MLNISDTQPDETPSPEDNRKLSKPECVDVEDVDDSNDDDGIKVSTSEGILVSICNWVLPPPSQHRR